MATKTTVLLDAELKRVLEIAAEMAPIPNEPHIQQTQSTWPWQVPQVPSYTTDHIPPEPNYIR